MFCTAEKRHNRDMPHAFYCCNDCVSPRIPMHLAGTISCTTEPRQTTKPQSSRSPQRCRPTPAHLVTIVRHQFAGGLGEAQPLQLTPHQRVLHNLRSSNNNNQSINYTFFLARGDTCKQIATLKPPATTATDKRAGNADSKGSATHILIYN
jgi:hypothetical protein